MNISIKETFKITSRKLFVIVTDANYNELNGITMIYNKERTKSFPVVSVEWIDKTNESLTGITLKYESKEDVDILKKLAIGCAVVA